MEKQNIILTASTNSGTGLWTSICIGCCELVGKESFRLRMKQNSVVNKCKSRIEYELSKLEGYQITKVKVEFSGKLACSIVAVAEPIK